MNSGQFEIEQSCIRTWHALLGFFIIGLAVASYIHFAIQGHVLGPSNWGRSFGTVVGGALSLVALPAIVIVPWRLVRRRRRATNTPILIAAILFAIFAYSSIKGAYLAP